MVALDDGFASYLESFSKVTIKAGSYDNHGTIDRSTLIGKTMEEYACGLQLRNEPCEE
jgi:hypothetical protein